MFWKFAPLGVVCLVLLVGPSTQYVLLQPQDPLQPSQLTADLSSSLQLTPLSPALLGAKNETEETVIGGIFLRRILLGAFLPGGLGEAIVRKEAPKYHASMTDSIQEMKEELAGIKKILQEQQDKEAYRERLAAQLERERQEKDAIDVFDVIEFVILVCVVYILFKVIYWLCKCAEKSTTDQLAAAAAANQAPSTKADEAALLECPTNMTSNGSCYTPLNGDLPEFLGEDHFKGGVMLFGK